MKFTLEKAPGIQIHGYQTGAITLRHAPNSTATNQPLVTHRSSLILSNVTSVHDWNVAQISELELHHFALVWEIQPEIVLLGSGQRMLFPPQEIRQEFALKGIGLEAMDTSAACRTYNVLMSEGRNVMACLIID